jgi:hypothetical protein
MPSGRSKKTKNGTKKLLISTNVNLLVKTYLIENKRGLSNASKEACMEVNSTETKYIFMSCHQNANKIIV